MKKLVLSVGVIVGLMACGNNNDTALKKLQSHIDSFASNKKTLETISLTSDTSYAHDRITKVIKDINEFVKENKERMDKWENDVKTYTQLNRLSYYVSYRSLINICQDGVNDCMEHDEYLQNQLNQYKIKLNRINNGDEKDSVIIKYTYQFKIKDINNTIVRDTAYVTYYQDKNTWSQVKWYNKK